MISIGVRTEYSFNKLTYGYMEKAHEFCPEGFCVADIHSSYGHHHLQKLSIEKDVPYLFGVRFQVVLDIELREKKTKLPGAEHILIAKNQNGLQELYELIRTAYKNFYYTPMLGVDTLNEVSDNIIVVSHNPFDEERVDFVGLTFMTPKVWRQNRSIPKVAIQDNLYFHVDDKETYQLFAGGRKDKDSYLHFFDTSTYPRHILTEDEWLSYFRDEEAINNTYAIVDMCEEFTIPKAPMVRFKAKAGGDIETLCMKGALKLDLDISEPEYEERLLYELDLIAQKDYVDYFLVVADIISKAKETMLVGPSRGSSAGSLVCYLLGITTIDPIEHGLIFERFIDVNRQDLPDIDIDFPDVKRSSIIKYTTKKYGEENVGTIGTISRLKPKSAIGEFAKELGIPPWETDVIKNSMIQRSSGDARSGLTIRDTFETTELGKEFIQRYPMMMIVGNVQDHARHIGKHAAGVVVCNEPLSRYAGINAREGTIMLDKKDAEALSLLKIDFLGLRTLSVLEETAKLAGFDFHEFYEMPLDDKKVFKIFQQNRLCGIFQFEGHAVKGLTKDQKKIDHFNDITALTSLGRPGPLHSGAAIKFIKRRNGDEEVSYTCDHEIFVDITKDTFGLIVYQEQVMFICRRLGKMDWADVSAIRNAMAKSKGEEFFNKYRDKFVEGALEHGITEKLAIKTWNECMTFGSWGFNKSHAVAYGMISYWTAWCKVYHPKEFAVANLIHSKSEDSSLKLLREFVRDEGFEYIPVDPDESDIDWKVSEDGKILGGLMNIKGIALQKARDAIKCRNGEKEWTPALFEKLMRPETPFDELFPCYARWSDFYENPAEYGLKKVTEIQDIDKKGNYTFIGLVTIKDLRDLNDYNEIMKRGGEVYKDNTQFLKLFVEDDTDSIQCRIGRFKFDELNGKQVSEEILQGKSWVIINGFCNGEFRLISINSIGILEESD